MAANPTYYELLGVSPSATQTEIKSAFRQLALRNHPDQGGNAVLFRMIEDAYEVLISPSRRSDYDAWLSRDDGARTPPGGVRMPEDAWASAASEQDDWAWDGADAAASAHRDPDGGSQPAEEFDESVDPAEYWERPTYSGTGPTWSSRFQVVREYAAEHRTKVLLIAAALWISFCIATSMPLLPGMSDVGAVVLILSLLFLWMFGSIALRIAGWYTLIFALVQARWADAPAGLTAARIALAAALWLAGQWFYTWRRGEWRSGVAAVLLTKLPWALRPDRRFL